MCHSNKIICNPLNFCLYFFIIFSLVRICQPASGFCQLHPTRFEVLQSEYCCLCICKKQVSSIIYNYIYIEVYIYVCMHLSVIKSIVLHLWIVRALGIISLTSIKYCNIQQCVIYFLISNWSSFRMNIFWHILGVFHFNPTMWKKNNEFLLCYIHLFATLGRTFAHGSITYC